MREKPAWGDPPITIEQRIAELERNRSELRAIVGHLQGRVAELERKLEAREERHWSLPR